MNSIASSARSYLVLLFFLHLVMGLFFFPPHHLFSSDPWFNEDFPLHEYRSTVLSRQLAEHGKFWAYDPNFMAGYPLGTIYDLDNKLAELFVAISGPVLGRILAFKLYVWGTFLAGFPLMILAVRLIGLSGRRLSVFATFLLLLLHTDFYIVSFLLFGGVGYIGGVFSAFLIVCLYASLVERPRKARWGLLIFFTPFLFWYHVLTAFVCFVPLLLCFLSGARRHGTRFVLLSGAYVLAILIVNAPWLTLFARFAHYKTLGQSTHDFFQSPGPAGLVGYLLREPGTLCGRVILFLGIPGILLLRGRAAVGRPMAVGAIFLLCSVFFGSYVPAARHLEPLRLIIPALLFLLIPASLGWGRLRQVKRVTGRWHGVFLAACFGLLIVPSVLCPGSTYPVFTFALGGYHLAGLPPQGEQLVSLLASNLDGSGRLLLEDAGTGDGDMIYFSGHFPAYLPLLLDIELIGGPEPDAYLDHHRTDFTNGRLLGQSITKYPLEDLVDIMRIYNITHVLSWNPVSLNHLGRWPQIFQRIGVSGPFVLFKVSRQPSFAIDGTASVRAEIDTIHVRNASPGGITLAYHWLETLRTIPPMPLLRVESKFDPVGFIRVENGDQSDFVIVNDG